MLFTRLSFALVLAFPVGAESALLAEWDFDSGNLAPSGGVQSGIAGLTTTGGTVSFPVRGAGRALQLAGSSSPQSLTLALSGTGLSDFQVRYEAVSSVFAFIFAFNTSFGQTWSWSTDNVTYSSAGITAQPGPITSAGGYEEYSVDFSGVSQLNGSSSVFLRNEIQPVFGGTTNLRFDNLSVSAVPEPSGIFTLLFGLALAFLAVRNHFTLPRRSPATPGGSESR